MIYKHLKSGGYYAVVCEGKVESDETPVVVYRSLQDGQVWVRAFDEFYDGRFAPQEARALIREKEILEGNIALYQRRLKTWRAEHYASVQTDLNAALNKLVVIHAALGTLVVEPKIVRGMAHGCSGCATPCGGHNEEA